MTETPTPETPKPPAGATPEPPAAPATAAVPATPETPAPAAPKPPEPKPDWRESRIAELTAKLNKEKELRQAAESRVPTTPAAQTSPGVSEAEIAARVSTEAQRLAQIAAWNEACNAVASNGGKKFSDFNERLRAVQGVVNHQDETEAAQYAELLSAAIETGKAEDLIYSLGANPGEVTRLMRMSPVKRAVEVAMMAARLETAAAPEPSSVPKPVTPLGSRGLHYDGLKPDDPANGTKLPISEWMKQREKQAEERGIQ